MSAPPVQDTGERDLPALLCLHSLFLDPRMFDGLAQAAAGRFRVVRPTFRGQGEHAGEVDDLVSMDACADDVVGLVDELQLAPARVVAQSMGGDVALRVAARRPDAVAAMVLLGTSARDEPPENLEAFRPIADTVEREGFRGEILEMTMGIMFGQTSRTSEDPEVRARVETWHERIAALPPALCHAIRGVVERPSAVDLLPSVRAPTLVVSGTEDVARPPAWADEVVAGLPEGELWRLEGIGHSPVLEAPGSVLPRILSFFEQAAPPAQRA